MLRAACGMPDQAVGPCMGLAWSLFRFFTTRQSRCPFWGGELITCALCVCPTMRTSGGDGVRARPSPVVFVQRGMGVPLKPPSETLAARPQPANGSSSRALCGGPPPRAILLYCQPRSAALQAVVDSQGRRTGRGGGPGRGRVRCRDGGADPGSVPHDVMPPLPCRILRRGGAADALGAPVFPRCVAPRGCALGSACKYAAGGPRALRTARSEYDSRGKALDGMVTEGPSLGSRWVCPLLLSGLPVY